MVEQKAVLEPVYIGGKEIARYISACFYALNASDEVKIISRGSHIKRALDVLAILKRDYLENPEYLILVDSEPFESRNVTSVEITLKGKRKIKEK